MPSVIILSFLLYKKYDTITNDYVLYTTKGGNILKNIVAKWNGTSLILRIVIGMVIGAALGIFVPQASYSGSVVKTKI